MIPVGFSGWPISPSVPTSPARRARISISSPRPRCSSARATSFRCRAARSARVDAVDHRRSDVDAWGRSEHLRELTRRLYDPIYKHYFRVEWEHFDRLPETGGALIVANHAGAIPPDAPAIMHGIEKELGRRVYGLAENLFRSVPVVGTLWARGGGVAAHPDNAYRLLHDEGQLVLVFPEGTKATGKRFTERYQLHRFGRGGFVEIAMRAGVPVIPIAVVGAQLRVFPVCPVRCTIPETRGYSTMSEADIVYSLQDKGQNTLRLLEHLDKSPYINKFKYHQVLEYFSNSQ